MSTATTSWPIADALRTWVKSRIVPASDNANCEAGSVTDRMFATTALAASFPQTRRRMLPMPSGRAPPFGLGISSSNDPVTYLSRMHPVSARLTSVANALLTGRLSRRGSSRSLRRPHGPAADPTPRSRTAPTTNSSQDFGRPVARLCSIRVRFTSLVTSGRCSAGPSGSSSGGGGERTNRVSTAARTSTGLGISLSI